MPPPSTTPANRPATPTATRSPASSRARSAPSPPPRPSSHSAGVFHWTPEGRRLYDFTSGVLVSNLGHNPTALDAPVRRVHGLAGGRIRRRADGIHSRPCR